MDNAKQTIEIPTLEYLTSMFKTEEDYERYLNDHPNEVDADSKNPIDCWVSHAFGWGIYDADPLNSTEHFFIERVYREEFIPRIIENQSKLTSFEVLSKDFNLFDDAQDYQLHLHDTFTEKDLTSLTDLHLWEYAVGHYVRQINKYIEQGFDKETIYRNLYESLFMLLILHRDKPDVADAITNDPESDLIFYNRMNK